MDVGRRDARDGLDLALVADRSAQVDVQADEALAVAVTWTRSLFRAGQGVVKVVKWFADATPTEAATITSAPTRAASGRTERRGSMAVLQRPDLRARPAVAVIRAGPPAG